MSILTTSSETDDPVVKSWLYVIYNIGLPRTNIYEHVIVFFCFYNHEDNFWSLSLAKDARSNPTKSNKSLIQNISLLFRTYFTLLAPLLL